MRYLKVYQNVNFAFNLSDKPISCDMRFTAYMILANSAIFSICDIIKTLFWTPVLVAEYFPREYIYVRYMPKAFSIRKIWGQFLCFDSTIENH